MQPVVAMVEAFREDLLLALLHVAAATRQQYAWIFSVVVGAVVLELLACFDVFVFVLFFDVFVCKAFARGAARDLAAILS